MIRHVCKIACTGMIFLGFLFGSCKDEDFTIGKYLPVSHISTGMIDTLTIRVSNLVVCDSVVTSGKMIGFTGAYEDPQIGVVQAKTYIEFGRTSDNETDRYAKFDSVTLVLRPNGNYYGDTTKYAAFEIFSLVKPIQTRDDGYLYSTSTVPVGKQYADTAFKAKVKDIKNNEIEIKLSDSFGEKLFQGILKDDDDYKAANFLKTFPGLSVTAGSGSACVHGLNLADSACMIRIYYHISTSYKEKKTMTFKANPNNSFYNLNYDKLKLPFFNAKSDPVPSAQTDNKGIIMSGSTPMYSRLEFPHLNEMLWLGQIVKIQKAILYVRPIRHSFDTVPLPPKLNLYYFDPTSNTPLSDAIKPPSMGYQNTGPQLGNLPADYQHIQRPDFPQYTFDVTEFIASQLGKTGYNKWALSLIIPGDSRETTLQRLVFGDQKYWYKSERLSMENQIKLEVIYVVYND